MDIEPVTTKPISDDQELAKALAGVSEKTSQMDFEETPAPISPTPISVSAPDDKPEEKVEEPKMPEQPNDMPVVDSPVTDDKPVEPALNSNLEDIRKNALNELRPLVDKLNLQPEEKFDIYLLLLRNTDDTTLIAPAHEAAQSIPDESRKAQALLDVIKEIDYLSSPQQPAA